MNPVPRPRPRGMDGGTVGATTGPGRGGGGSPLGTVGTEMRSGVARVRRGFPTVFWQISSQQFYGLQVCPAYSFRSTRPERSDSKNPRNNARDQRGRGRP